MEKCPVCEKETTSPVCGVCGFDASRDYENFPTLAELPEGLPSRRSFSQRYLVLKSREGADTTGDGHEPNTKSSRRWIPAAIAGAVVLTAGALILALSGIEKDPCAKGHNWAEATYEQPSRCKICGITTGHEKGYIGNVGGYYSQYGVDLGYHYGIPCYVLDAPIINCRSFNFSLFLGEAYDGTPLGNWEFYVKTTDGVWTSIGTANIQTYESTNYFGFETPISFTAIAATRLSTSPATHTMGYSISDVQVYTD